MFDAIFTQAAREDLIDAQDWYEGEAPGLGPRFRAEIDTAIGRISANPLQFPVVFKNVRRALLRKFPYMLFFTIEDDKVACDRLFPREPGSPPVAAARVTTAGEPNEYFLMGDNRDNCPDSRAFGPVLRQRFAGKTIALLPTGRRIALVLH